MFNFSFYELMVFGILALIILGPEKLPQAVRTMGTYYAKFRRTVGTLKAEMEAELDLAETRQLMQQELEKIRKSEAQMQKEMAQLRGSMQEFEQQQNSQLQQLQSGNTSSSKPAEKDEKQWIHPVANANPTPNYAYESSALQKADSGSTKNDAITDQDSEHQAQPSDQAEAPMTRPWENMWFLLGDYDRVRRLPPAPFLPNYTANPLLYTMGTGSDNSTEVGP